MEELLSTRYILIGRAPDGRIMTAGFNDLKDLKNVIEKTQITDYELLEKEDWKQLVN